MRQKSLREYITEHALPCAILIVAALVVYLRILGHDFQLFWDDEKYVTANAAVKGVSLEHLRLAFTTNYMGNYAPLQIVSYMLDYTLWGMKAGGFFLTNILLHAANGVLFYAILLRLGLKRTWACFSALLFLLHPVQVESVAWISERKNLLALFFSLAAFISYLNYRGRREGGGKSAYAASFLLFLFALLCKAVAVVFPLVLVLYDLCFVGRGERSRWQRDKVPFAVAAVGIALLTVQFQTPGQVPGAGGGRVPWHGGSPFATFLTMLTVLPRYLGLLFWPTGLSAVYDPPIRTGIDAAVIAGGMVCALLVAVGVALFRRERRLFFCYGLFFVFLLPVSQVVPLATLMNERYLYFPMLGAAALAGALASVVYRLAGWRRGVVFASAGIVLVALTGLSFARVGVWRNDLTLWRDAAAKSRNNHVALYGLAQALQNSGDLDAALPIYQRILTGNPRHLDTLTHLGALYNARNMPLAARPYLIDVTRYYPQLASGFVDLGLNYYQTNELDASERALRRGEELQPGSREALMHLGVICLQTHRLDAARDYFTRLVALGGANADVEYNLACVESLSRHPREALRHLEAAFRLGFRDRESVEKDPDLNGVRLQPDFRLLVSSYLGEKEKR